MNWSLFVLLYLLFLGWHGAFQGPLSTAEIDQYLHEISQLAPEKDIAFLQKVLQNYEGGPVIMVNAIKLYDEPILIDGKKLGDSSEEVLKKYSDYVGKYLIKRGSYPLYVGSAMGPAAAMWGIENGEEWTSAAVVRYSNLRTLLNMALSPEFEAFHVNKLVAVEKTIAYPTQARLIVGQLEVLVFFVLLSMVLISQLVITRQRSKQTSK